MTPLKQGFGPLTPAREARSIILRHAQSMPAEDVALLDLPARILTSDVLAPIDVPHFPKSSMDGYAVIATDTSRASEENPVVLRLQSAIATGEWPSEAGEPGNCAEIGTGAALPSGYDAVVMVESTSRDGELVSVKAPAAAGENIISPGSDVSSGSIVAGAGTRVGANHLGVLAALGLEKVSVASRPRVGLLSTGPELLAPGAPLTEGKIFEINSFTVGAALASDGAEVVDLGVVPDQLDHVVKAAADGSANTDVLIVSGGSSLGAGDLVVETFEALGELLLHGVAVKPGKPLAVGLTSAGKLMIGLPGFPVSALCDYYLFVRPLIFEMTGLRPQPFSSKTASLGVRHESPNGFYEFRLVRLEGGRAMPIYRGSSEISAFGEADGYFEIDEQTEVIEEGSPVEVTRF
ncbi:MAG TPA: gephyrin-like molybdotransferase Glp [Actinomycetota bacterium]|nr:gephyrin-like molybdotransferase Glp [Actinomycetota bacterium]